MRTFVLAVAFVSVAPAGCNNDPPAPGANASASAAVSARPVRSAPTAGKSSKPPKKWPIPTGPRLKILPGKGLGAIRLGATVETVERQMELKCQDKTEKICRYVTRSVELFLEDEKVKEIRVHRVGRPAGPDKSGNPRTYGIFNGELQPGAQLGMLKSFVVQAMGKAEREEQVTGDNPFNTVELHHYPGMTLEFDRIEGKKELVLSGIVIKER